jgi:hypothetical protein
LYFNACPRRGIAPGAHGIFDLSFARILKRITVKIAIDANNEGRDGNISDSMINAREYKKVGRDVEASSSECEDKQLDSSPLDLLLDGPPRSLALRYLNPGQPQ